MTIYFYEGWYTQDMTETIVRKFRDTDAAPAAQIFYDAVHIGAKEFYDEDQRNAWAPKIPDTDVWCKRLKSQTTYIAERDGVVVGYMTLDDQGYIDLTFVAPQFAGKGIARKLYEIVEKDALDRGITHLTSNASYLARPFFERQNWLVLKQQIIERGDVTLANFVMEKYLCKNSARSRVG